jgi:hypothetical protein
MNFEVVYLAFEQKIFCSRYAEVCEVLKLGEVRSPKAGVSMGRA